MGGSLRFSVGKWNFSDVETGTWVALMKGGERAGAEQRLQRDLRVVGEPAINGPFSVETCYETFV